MNSIYNISDRFQFRRFGYSLLDTRTNSVSNQSKCDRDVSEDEHSCNLLYKYLCQVFIGISP